MKNFLTLALVLLLSCCSANDLFSQANSTITTDAHSSGDDSTQFDRPNILKTNLAGPLSLLYEARVYPRRSIQVSVNRVNFGLLGDQDNYFGLTGAIKFLLFKTFKHSQKATACRFLCEPLPAIRLCSSNQFRLILQLQIIRGGL